MSLTGFWVGSQEGDSHALSHVTSHVTASAVHQLPCMRVFTNACFLHESPSRSVQVGYVSKARQYEAYNLPGNLSGGQAVVQSGHQTVG